VNNERYKTNWQEYLAYSKIWKYPEENEWILFENGRVRVMPMNEICFHIVPDDPWEVVA